MPKLLTNKQIKQYQDEGFISPIRVIEESEALLIADMIKQAEQDYPKEIHSQRRNNLHLSFSFLDSLAHNKIIVDAIEDLIGPDIALWGSVMFIKEPSSSQYVSWHQDATYMGMSNNSFATPWIALTHSNVETGCMSMISGSHKQQISKHVDTFASNNILTRGQEIIDVDESLSVDLVLRPGEMSVHSGTIIHGSKPNKSEHRRVGFALQSFMPTNIEQTIGENNWTHIRGKKRHYTDGIMFDRPRFDMDPVTLSQRVKSEENFANILYKGSKIKRNY